MEAATKTLYGFETHGIDQRRSDRAGVHDIKQLWQRSHEILALVLQGHDHKVIAKVLNICEATVSNTVNCPLGREKLAKMREERDGKVIEVSKEVSRLSEKAIKVYEDIFDSDTLSYNLKKTAADTVLMDLGGHRAPTKLDTRSLHMTASMEEIEEFKSRGIKAAKEAGMLVEVKDESGKTAEGVQ